MNKFLPLIIALILAPSSFAQTPCGTHEYETYLNEQFPGFDKILQQSRAEALNGVQRMAKIRRDTVYRIPVVFHIVWNTAAQNLHDSLIHSQMKTLNEAFRHNHADTGLVRSIFKPVAGDTRIEFYLADKDPDGNPTTGINRVKTNKTDFGSFGNLFAESVKSSSSQGVDAWNTDKYLNIWVCKFTFNGTILTAAYAFPPTNARFWSATNFTSKNLQGVVVNFNYIGANNPNDNAASSLREKTLPHEVGHFLGLRHIWADKNNTCAGEDDGLADTPLSSSATRTVNFSKNTCKETVNDKMDMIENYMDYTPYPYTRMFTMQQSDLMRYNLLNLRSDLPELKVTIPPGQPYEQFKLFPNPAGAVVNLHLQYDGEYTYTFTDVTGRVVQNGSFNVKGPYDYTLNTDNLSPGIYHIALTINGDQLHRQKILIH